jgi:hypothetical protein
MPSVFEQLVELTKELLVDAVMSNMTSLFDMVNSKVSSVAADVGAPPSSFAPAVFSMVRNLSETVIMPIAGIILTYIACYELIHLVIAHNNLANFESWIFFKWLIKTFIAVEMITHCFDISLAIFDVAQHVVDRSAGVIAAGTAIDASALATMRSTLEAMGFVELFGLWLEIFIVKLGLSVMSMIIFLVVYGRMIEIYLVISLAPIPMSTCGNKEQSQIGQNYIRSLLALGFQGFLIMVCIGIYAALITSVTFSSDIAGSLWGAMGYTVLLCFALFKTSSVTKSVFQAR